MNQEHSTPVIDKNIPLPCRYPFAELEVGESFFVPNQGIGILSKYKARSEQRTGFKFTTRTVSEGGIKGVRVWRVS